MHTKSERLLSKSLTTLKVMAYYLVVHTGQDPSLRCTSMLLGSKQPTTTNYLTDDFYSLTSQLPSDKIRP